MVYVYDYSFTLHPHAQFVNTKREREIPNGISLFILYPSGTSCRSSQRTY